MNKGVYRTAADVKARPHKRARQLTAAVPDSDLTLACRCGQRWNAADTGGEMRCPLCGNTQPQVTIDHGSRLPPREPLIAQGPVGSAEVERQG